MVSQHTFSCWGWPMSSGGGAWSTAAFGQMICVPIPPDTDASWSSISGAVISWFIICLFCVTQLLSKINLPHILSRTEQRAVSGAFLKLKTLNAEFKILKIHYFVFRPQLAASHCPPKEPAGSAAVPPGPLPSLRSSHVHHHLPQTLPPP